MKERTQKEILCKISCKHANLSTKKCLFSTSTCFVWKKKNPKGEEAAMHQQFASLNWREKERKECTRDLKTKIISKMLEGRKGEGDLSTPSKCNREWNRQKFRVVLIVSRRRRLWMMAWQENSEEIRKKKRKLLLHYCTVQRRRRGKWKQILRFEGRGKKKRSMDATLSFSFQEIVRVAILHSTVPVHNICKRVRKENWILIQAGSLTNEDGAMLC